MSSRASALLVAFALLAGCTPEPRPPAPESPKPKPGAPAPPSAPGDTKKAPPPTVAAPNKDLYSRLGKEEAIRAVVDELLARATVNPAIAKRFAGVNVPGL